MKDSKQNKKRIICVTGTDTGVGKTVFSGLLLSCLRNSGINAIAMKPFCSGGRGDARLLSAIQDNLIPMADINPFFFRKPLAPQIAAEMEGRLIAWKEVKKSIYKCLDMCDLLIIEGAGGLLSPLGKNYSILDVAKEFPGRVVIVGANRLGVINQVLLTVKLLEVNKITDCGVVLMGQRYTGMAAKTNMKALASILGNKRIFEVPFLHCNIKNINEIKHFSKIFQKTLALAAGISRFNDVTRQCQVTQVNRS